MTIQRSNLREQVKREILERLAAGKIVTGTTVNEVRLALDLGVSRTPLREALISLQNDGVIAAEAGKGFFWVPVSMREFQEITPIVAALESLAIEATSADDLAAVAPQLIAEARAYSKDSAVHSELIRADDAWHGLMLSACSNRRLLDLIAVQRTALRRYERLVVGDNAIIRRVAKEHLTIAQCLAVRDKAGAVEALKVNWRGGHDRLRAQLEGRLG